MPKHMRKSLKFAGMSSRGNKRRDANESAGRAGSKSMVWSAEMCSLSRWKSEGLAKS